VQAPTPWRSVLTLADEQWGLVTTQQVEATGVAWSTLARHVRAGELERVAHGVYRVQGSGTSDQLELKAAWLQLSPATPAWLRSPDDGIVSHRSAAALYGIGPLPADVHEFTLPNRKQSRRNDVRLHRRPVPDEDRTTRHGLPVTRPHRIAADLLSEREDPGAVGELIIDTLHLGDERAEAVIDAIAGHANSYGLARGDGAGFLEWLLELSGTVDRP
jgi:predicted transcriptional regulator of viral defense system